MSKDLVSLALACLVLGLGIHLHAAQRPPDWQEQVRERVAAHQLDGALAIVEGRLAEVPQDLEARGWRGRLLAWTDRLPEAEVEYRRVLDAAPNDTDILTGLADVLAREQRYSEALALLTRVRELDPSRPEILARRGRVLRSLGRVEEARLAFREALGLDPENAEAKAGQASLTPDPRHEFRIGTDADYFNYTDTAQAQTVSLSSRWSPRWSTSVAGNFYQRFGENAGKFTASVTRRFGARDALTAGGGVGNKQTVIPENEAFFEYVHGFRLGDRHFLRGAETGYHQHWFWYQNARILALTSFVLFYLPREWTWSLAVTAARSRFPATSAEWRPSGVTRLSVPLHRRVTANLFFSVGTENFARVDQIGRFSARTFGGGLRFRITSRQDVSLYVFHQDRSQGRTQNSFGLSYGIRF